MSAGTRTAGEGRAAGKSAQVRATEKGAIFHKDSDFPASPLMEGELAARHSAQIPEYAVLGTQQCPPGSHGGAGPGHRRLEQIPHSVCLTPDALCCHQLRTPAPFQNVPQMVLSPGISPQSLSIPTSDS